MSDIIVRNTTVGLDGDLAEFPELIALARPIVAEWEAAVARVAATALRPRAFKAGSREELLQRRFDRLPDDRRLRSVQRATAMLRSAPFQKRVNPFVDLRRLTGDMTVDAVRQPSAPVPKALPQTVINKIIDQRNKTLGLPGGGKVAPPSVKKLSLQLVRMVCIDETNGFLGSEAGEDEIELGGVALDGSKQIGKISPFNVGDFDDGTRVELKNKTVHTFNLNSALTYPKSYFVTFVMVEADNGNFSQTMEDIIQKLAKESADKLAALIGASVGASAGGPAGALIGMIIGWIIGKVVSFFISVWEDDPFEPRTVEAIIPTFDAKLANPENVVKFFGPGEYAMRYRWTTA